jgi:hypothetical protein
MHVLRHARNVWIALIVLNAQIQHIYLVFPAFQYAQVHSMGTAPISAPPARHHALTAQAPPSAPLVQSISIPILPASLLKTAQLEPTEMSIRQRARHAPRHVQTASAQTLIALHA